MMSLPISPKNIPVYSGLLQVIWKHGNQKALDSIGFSKLPGFSKKDEQQSKSDELADDLEELGPTFVKIGQLLSAQLNILPPEYMKALSRLQDDAKALPFEEIKPVIEEELEQPLHQVFRRLDPDPVGSASLAQVYRGALPDGSAVAIKVQRPGCREQIEIDFEALSHLAEALDHLTKERYALSEICDYTRKLIDHELDYLLEAHNLQEIQRLMADVERVRIPRAHVELCSERVLIMDYLPGKRLTDMKRRELRAIGGEELAEELFKKYLDHILVEGFFHADPHPGNVLVHEDNTLVMLDLGMVGRVPPQLRQHLTQLVLAVVDGRGEDVAESAVQIGVPLDGYDRDQFRGAISELVLLHHNNSISTTNIGDVVLEIAKICGQHYVKITPLLSMVGKTLVNLDQLGQQLSPGFNPSQSIRRHTFRILRQQVVQAINPSAFFGEAIEIKRLAQNLPVRLNRILDMLAREDRGIKVDAIDEIELIRGVEKIANRITLGLIIAALFISGAMIMNTDTDHIPILSIILFIVGGIGVVFVALSMLVFRGSSKLKDKNHR
ncbi:MAG: AarF/UbiB family protein [Akkermansiaceae bacterium]|nr:AarF/UbiB family protein [Akkermansiaceae bacterium]